MTEKRVDGVGIGYCHPEMVSGQFTSSLIGVLLHDAHAVGRIVKHGGVISMLSSPRIASTRNQIIRQFLGSNAKYLLFIDADMTFEPDTVERMVATMREHKLTMLGGLAFVLSRQTRMLSPTMNILTNADPIRTEPVMDYPANAVCRVDTTGAACLMLDRVCLEDVYKMNADSPFPWFAETVNGVEEIGEDVTFCIRAMNAGHELYVHTGIKFGHMKTQPLTEEDYRAWRVKVNEEIRTEAKRTVPLDQFFPPEVANAQ